jgi:acetyl esterase/lipase
VKRLLPGPIRGVRSADITEVRWLAGVRHRPGRDAVGVIETRLDSVAGRLRGRFLVVDSAAESDGGVRPAPDVDVVAAEWSPTGLIAALLTRSGEVVLWEPDLGESHPVPEVRATGSPSWAADGSTVVVPGRVGADSAVWGIGVSGGRPGGLAAVARVTARECRCSPTGSLVAYLLDDPDQGDTLVVIDRERPSVHPLIAGRGHLEGLVWSPDGSSIAVTGSVDAARNRELLVVAVATAEVVNLTAALDVSVGSGVQSDDPRGYGDTRLCWSAGTAGRTGESGTAGRTGESGTAGRTGESGTAGRTGESDTAGIVGTLARGGRGLLVRVPVDPVPAALADLEVLSEGDRAVVAFDVLPGGEIAAVISDPATPGELVMIAADGSAERRLTTRNRDWLATRELASVDHVVIEGATGDPIDAWIYPPAGGGPAPVLLAVHGGPHWPCGWRFSFDYQRLAALGVAVVAANPTGSGGYGERFARTIQHDWGGRDRADLMRVVDGLAGRPDLDADRWAVGGVSYGGYLSALFVTGTDRFRGAIVENGISDLARHAARVGRTPAGRRYLQTELGDPAGYRSPLSGADAIGVPVLLVHAEDDRTCAIEQSEALAAALGERGAPVDFVRLPGEGHLMVLDGTLDTRMRRWAAVDSFLAERLGWLPGALPAIERNDT